MGSARFLWGGSSAKPIRKLRPAVEVIESFGIFSKLSVDDFPDQDAGRMATMVDRLRVMTIVHTKLGTGYSARIEAL